MMKCDPTHVGSPHGNFSSPLPIPGVLPQVSVDSLYCTEFFLLQQLCVQELASQ
jgi:hypothetical protein